MPIDFSFVISLGSFAIMMKPSLLYTQKLYFTLIEDTNQREIKFLGSRCPTRPQQKCGFAGAGWGMPEKEALIGNLAGGHVFFINTDDSIKIT